MFEANLLGVASFSVNGVILKTDLGRSGRLLACYLLAFMGRAHRRERLAALFWPELDERHAGGALSTALWRLRRLLDQGRPGAGTLVAADGPNIVLQRDPAVSVDSHALGDVAGFLRDLACPAALGPADERRLADALDRYAGPFLDGDDGDWVVQERERLDTLAVGAGLGLMHLAARRRQDGRALAFGRRVLAIDPFHEAAHHDMMVLFVLTGQRPEALHSYRRFRDLLRDELSVEPIPEVRRLYAEIASGSLADASEDELRGRIGQVDRAREPATAP